MTDDPIVKEVRKAREDIFRRCGSDLKKLGKHLERRRKSLGLKVVKAHRKQSKTG